MAHDPRLLVARRVSESRDVDMTRSFMQARDFYLDLAPRQQPKFEFVASAIYLPHGYIGYIHYGAAAQVKAPATRARDDYFIHLPIAGTAEVFNDRGTVVCDARHAVISSPAGHGMQAAEGSSRQTLSLNRTALTNQLAMLLGEQPKQALSFAPSVDLDSAAGRRLARYVEAALIDLGDPAPAHNALIESMHEQLIMTGLLLTQPSNYSEAIARRDGAPAPRDIKRAIDYIHAHLDAPLTLEDIVLASGISGRTLLKHFRDHTGTSPMRYLRRARMDRVREALMRRDQRASVTDIAIAHGFLHLGRFATEYRREFGEPPSETMRRARRE